MIFSEHVKIREEKFGTIIFETLREKVFVTNRTGKDILNLLEKGYSIERIIETLADSYDVNPQEIKGDITEFVDQLKDNSIVEFNKLNEL